jgi:hypothetical protein
MFWGYLGHFASAPWCVKPPSAWAIITPLAKASRWGCRGLKNQTNAEKVPLNLIEVILAQGSTQHRHRPMGPESAYFLCQLERRHTMENTTNQALTPVSPDQRVFDARSHASLWFSLGVGLLVIQVGAYLVPAVGTQDAVWAILVGSVLGAGLLAWTARIGCASGLSSAGLMHSVYGPSMARLPVLLNILQLVGWTSFELVVMRDGTAAILKQAWGLDPASPLTLVLRSRALLSTAKNTGGRCMVQESFLQQKEKRRWP